MAEIPDFSVKTPAVDPTAIASVMQQKAAQEEVMRANKVKERTQRINDLLSAVKQGQEIAANAMALSDARNKRQGAEMLQSILKEPTKDAVVGTKPSPALPPGVAGPLEPPTPLTFGETQQGQTQPQRMKEAAFKAGIIDKQLAESLFPELASSRGVNKGFQQSAIMVKGKDGKLHTVSATFDVNTGKTLHPLTGEPITAETDLSELPQRGYSPENSKIGQTVDGKPVLKDRMGNIMLSDGTKYDGPLFPNLENAPQSVVDALAGLDQAGQQLNDIENAFSNKLAGPIAGRMNSLALWLDSEDFSSDERTEFVTQLNAYRNTMIKVITGAQMSEPEATRLLLQLPNEKFAPAAFFRQLQIAQRETERAIANKTRRYEQAGYVIDRSKTVDPAKLEKMFDRQLGINTARLAEKPTKNKTTKTIESIKTMGLDELKKRRDELLKKRNP